MMRRSVDLPAPLGPEHADLGIRVEGQMHVIQHLLAAGIGLRETPHMIDELSRHELRPIASCMKIRGTGIAG